MMVNGCAYKVCISNEWKFVQIYNSIMTPANILQVLQMRNISQGSICMCWLSFQSHHLQKKGSEEGAGKKYMLVCVLLANIVFVYGNSLRLAALIPHKC